MNRPKRLKAKQARRKARVEKRRYARRCLFCKVKWWDYDEDRLKAWMLHHTANLCPAAKARADKIALALAKPITEEQAKQLQAGQLAPESLANPVPTEPDGQ